MPSSYVWNVAFRIYGLFATNTREGFCLCYTALYFDFIVIYFWESCWCMLFFDFEFIGLNLLTGNSISRILVDFFLNIGLDSDPIDFADWFVNPTFLLFKGLSILLELGIDPPYESTTRSWSCCTPCFAWLIIYMRSSINALWLNIKLWLQMNLFYKNFLVLSKLCPKSSTSIHSVNFTSSSLIS